MQKETHWWQNAIIYQIYPRSFRDSNADGIGDLPGIIEKLDYLQSLGVDAIWLSPVFRSPQDDNGYDISDYRDIDPMFGTMADMRRLLQEAGKRKLRILLDMVLNHTSDEHPWFREARKSRDNPKHDWYVWRDGVPEAPPNALQSCFGGSAWQWEPQCGQYYLHQFSVKQPDLNWDNPSVRNALYEMMRFWIAEGAGGFRFDVIDRIAKEPDKLITEEGSKLHSYIREMSAAVLQGTELVTVGEAWSADTQRARLWSKPDGSELSMVFQFSHIILDQKPNAEKWDLAPLPLNELKRVIALWQTELHQNGWNSLFLENHDLPRIVSRWGDDTNYREQSAKMLATLLFGLQGTPFIYQGQELGMTNVRFAPEEYQDIEIRNMIRDRLADGYCMEEILESVYAKGRDNARTPMQWNGGKHAGFSEATPWLRVAPNYPEVNVEAQERDGHSVLNYYKTLIALRKREPVFRLGDYQPFLQELEAVFAYQRRIPGRTLTVLLNFGKETVLLPASSQSIGTCVLHNYPDAPRNLRLRPYEAAMYLE